METLTQQTLVVSLWHCRNNWHIVKGRYLWLFSSSLSDGRHCVLEASQNSDGSGFPKQRRARLHLGEKQFTLMPRLWREGLDLQAPLVNSSEEYHSCPAHEIMFSVHLLVNTLFSPLTTGFVSYSALLLQRLNEKPGAGHKQNAFTEWDHYFSRKSDF